MTNFNSTACIQIPLTIEQIAFGLRQMPEDDLEQLEILLDDKFKKRFSKGEQLSRVTIKREILFL